MLALETLGFDEAQRALEAGRDEAGRRGLAMSFAVVDHVGALIACQRMDGAPARTLTHAMRKAYTSAEMGRDTARFSKDLEERGGNLSQWGNRRLTTLAGGCVVKKGDRVVGAVACGGAATDVDVAIAQVMIAAALSE